MARARTLWEEGKEPGRQVVVLGLACTLTVVVLELAIVGQLGPVFDVTFVLVCAALALAVRPQDFFTIGVLPPLLMVGIFFLLGWVRPEALAHEDSRVVQVIVSGLAHHSGALIIGYAVCLGVLAQRQRILARRRAEAAARSSRPSQRSPELAAG